MKLKTWGIVSIIASILVWLWAMISLPSFRFDGENLAAAKTSISIGFTVLTLISVATSVTLIRRK